MLKHLTILLFLTISTQTYAQSSFWMPVTEDTFLRKNIPTDKIQYVDASKDNVPADNTKIGRFFVNTSGQVFYWVNQRPQKVSSGFNVSLKISPPYLININDNKKYVISLGFDEELEKKIFKKNTRTFVISVGSKEVATFASELFANLWSSLANNLIVSKGVNISWLLSFPGFEKLSPQEKLNFFKKTLVDDPIKLIAALPAYDPPRVDITKFSSKNLKCIGEYTDGNSARSISGYIDIESLSTQEQ
jgi:hypothetical protein